MEICDIINETEEGSKDAIRAIKKRLSQNAGKDYTVVMYTLTILETCVKNCGKRFHLLACSKDFVQELVGEKIARGYHSVTHAFAGEAFKSEKRSAHSGAGKGAQPHPVLGKRLPGGPGPFGRQRRVQRPAGQRHRVSSHRFG